MKEQRDPVWIKVKRVIEQVIELMPNATPAEMARHAIANHEAIINAWTFSRLSARFRDALPTTPRRASPMRQKRPKLGHPGQTRLVGFEHIPTQIYVEPPSVRNKRGTRVLLRRATLQDQIASLDLAVNESAEELAQRRRLIALTRRYDRTQPGIVVEDVLKLQDLRNREAARKRAARARIKTER